MVSCAAHIGISSVMLSRVLHGHAAVSAYMDLRLAEALGTMPGYWLALQTQRHFTRESEIYQ
jgi:addiction module HigA family antidote